MEIIKELEELDRKREKLIGQGAIVVLGQKYLSGFPYLWSAFAERAFRFRSVAQARNFIRRHKLTAKAVKVGD